MHSSFCLPRGGVTLPSIYAIYVRDVFLYSAEFRYIMDAHWLIQTNYEATKLRGDRVIREVIK